MDLETKIQEVERAASILLVSFVFQNANELLIKQITNNTNIFTEPLSSRPRFIKAIRECIYQLCKVPFATPAVLRST